MVDCVVFDGAAGRPRGESAQPFPVLCYLLRDEPPEEPPDDRELPPLLLDPPELLEPEDREPEETDGDRDPLLEPDDLEPDEADGD